jgi:hypothetical protein
MKALHFSFLAVLSVVSFNCTDSSANKTNTENNSNGFAVVELFTSEGCSSCPPADNAVAQLLKEYNKNVFVLGYHVDYWDNLGWKDIFSDAAYTKRQREYGKILKLSSVYTPQVIVNGTDQFVGSDENKLKAAVNKDLQQASTVKLNIEARASDNKNVDVHYSTDAIDAKLNIALIQLTADNHIQRGENSGATLHHVNIVRDFQEVSLNDDGNVNLEIPGGLLMKDCSVIAFIQDAGNNKIIAAAEANIK